MLRLFLCHTGQAGRIMLHFILINSAEMIGVVIIRNHFFTSACILRMHLLYLVSGLLWKVNLNCIDDKWASEQTASKLTKTGTRTNHEKRLNCDGEEFTDGEMVQTVHCRL